MCQYLKNMKLLFVDLCVYMTAITFTALTIIIDVSDWSVRPFVKRKAGYKILSAIIHFVPRNDGRAVILKCTLFNIYKTTCTEITLLFGGLLHTWRRHNIQWFLLAGFSLEHFFYFHGICVFYAFDDLTLCLALFSNKNICKNAFGNFCGISLHIQNVQKMHWIDSQYSL